MKPIDLTIPTGAIFSEDRQRPVSYDIPMVKYELPYIKDDKEKMGR